MLVDQRFHDLSQSPSQHALPRAASTRARCARLASLSKAREVDLQEGAECSTQTAVCHMGEIIYLYIYIYIKIKRERERKYWVLLKLCVV